MWIERNESKNRLNRAKHNLSFELAQFVFDDPYHHSLQDRIVQGEQRWQTIGQINGVVIVLVAHTVELEIIRIISARKATKKERACYEKTQ